MRTQQAKQQQHRGDLRTLDHHESWRGVYALLDVEPSIEPADYTEPESDQQPSLPAVGGAATSEVTP